jgi:PAS domain S-box-containing protein
MAAKVNPKRSVRRSSKAEIDALFMSIGEGAIATDYRSRVNRVNQAALDILGFKEHELIGQWFPGKVLAEDNDGNLMSNLDRPMAQVFLTGRAISTRAYYYRKDRTKIPVSLTVSPILLNSKPIGAIEVFRDISREIELEQAKDEFVAIASHQLRTPATAVKQYIGLLLEGYSEPLSPNQRLFLERAYESNERQLHIVQQILRITQLELGKIAFEPHIYDVCEVVRDAAATLKGTFEQKKQSIVDESPETPVIGNVDPEQLQTAVENLLENASNYTRSGKTVTLRCEEFKGGAKIIIKDEGVGIDKKDFPKLFQKFSRVPNPLSVERGGTGLGLYWAAKIISMHGGAIKVASEINKGSTFTITLPPAV